MESKKIEIQQSKLMELFRLFYNGGVNACTAQMGERLGMTYPQKFVDHQKWDDLLKDPQVQEIFK